VTSVGTARRSAKARRARRGRQCARRPGAEGFEQAERQLWRVDASLAADAPGAGAEPTGLRGGAAPGDAGGPPPSAAARDADAGRAGSAPGLGPAPAGRGAARREGEVVGYWREHATLSHVVRQRGAMGSAHIYGRVEITLPYMVGLK